MDKQILALKQQGKSLREIAKELGISHMTVARILRKTVTDSDVTANVTPVTGMLHQMSEGVTVNVIPKLVTKEAVTKSVTSKLDSQVPIFRTSLFK